MPGTAGKEADKNITACKGSSIELNSNLGHLFRISLLPNTNRLLEQKPEYELMIDKIITEISSAQAQRTDVRRVLDRYEGVQNDYAEMLTKFVIKLLQSKESAVKEVLLVKVLIECNKMVRSLCV